MMDQEAIDPEALAVAQRVVRESAATEPDDPFVLVSLELVRLATQRAGQDCYRYN